MENFPSKCKKGKIKVSQEAIIAVCEEYLYSLALFRSSFAIINEQNEAGTEISNEDNRVDVSIVELGTSEVGSF